MPTTARSHLWQPLDIKKRHIRLLALDPNPAIDALPSGTLEIKSIDRHPVFDAVSHAWGGPQRTPPPYIDGCRVPITESLNACLRHLRHPTEIRRLWVDAICIKQDDLAERSQQVQLMEHIFRAADTVRVWLGDIVSERLPRLFATINTTAPEVKLLDAILGRLTYEDVTALALFTNSAWFSRLWVKQEAALARNLVFHHGSSQVRLAQVLIFKESHQRRSFQKPRRSTNDEKALGVAMTQLSRLGRTTKLIAGVQSDKDTLPEALTEFMHSLRRLKVYDPRDRIYGLTGVFSALFDDDLITIDYSLSPQKVYTDFTYNFITATKSLTILNQVSHDENAMPMLPTWVPDWSSPYHFESQARNLKSSNADFQAAGRWRFETPVLDRRQDLLGLRGSVFDRVSFVGPTCDIDPYLSSGIVGMKASESHLVLDVIEKWQANMLSNSSMFARTVLRDKAAEIETGEIEGKTTPDEAAMDTLKRAKSALPLDLGLLCRSVVRSRFFLCAGRRPGLGPPDTQEGDVVAVLHGGNVPYVLRKSERAEADMPNLYRFVGECYVHGIMKGEAVLGKTEHDFEDIWLE